MSDHNSNTMNLTLHVWRQKGPKAPGKLETYEAKHVSPDMSFLEG
jgi:succinate dehydrogenase / fumarate reductase iron-sulfur subunit